MSLAHPVERPFPRLKANVDVFRHLYRGEVWYVFHDRALDRIFRVSETGGEFLASMDGRRPMQDVMADFFERRDATPEDELQMRMFLRQIDGLGLLAGVKTSRVGLAERQAEQARKNKFKGFLKSPVTFRIPLIDPEPVLRVLAPLTPWLFGMFGLSVWLFVVLAGGAVAALHWHELSEDFIDRVFSLQNLVVAGAAYPAIKIVHEMMHALALKYYGCEVRRMGLIFVAGIPVPYVDASMSMTLADKYARILVAGAGVMAELFLFGIAAMLWSVSEPGLLHTLCYNIVILTGVSTLLFNGNPLQRYDGYYAMCDLVEIPDLGSRAARYLGYLGRRWVLGEASAVAPRASHEERIWFIIYGIASSIYRTTLVVTIALYIADTFPIAGAVLALWTLGGAAIGPVSAVTSSVRKARSGDGRRILSRLAVIIGAVLVFLFLIPVPSAVVTQGYVLLPEENQIRSRSSGILGELKAASGDTVEVGSLVAVLQSRELETRLARTQAAVEEMSAAYSQASASSRVQAGIARERLEQSRKEFAAAQAEFDGLGVRSPLKGVLVITNPQDLPGHWIGRGDVLAIVRPDGPTIVRTVVPQWQIDNVRRLTRSVSVRMSFDPLVRHEASILRIVPAATDVLPSPVLSLEGGGSFAVTNRDAEGMHTAEVLFRVDIQLNETLPLDYFNGRADVRFDLGLESPGMQMLRAIRLVFLRHFHA